MDQTALVSGSDIARLAGVGRAAVTNWRSRFPDFPSPVGGTAASPLFDLAEVERWLVAHGRARPIAPDERAWRQLDALRGAVEPADAIGLVGGFLVWRAAQSGPVEFGDDERGPRRLLRRLAQELPPVLAPPHLPDEATARAAHQLLRAVHDLAGERGPAATFEWFLERHLDAEYRRSAHTPSGLADLMAGFAHHPRSVYDPACGTGGLLMAVPQADPAVERRGADSSATAARIAAARLQLTGAAAQVQVRDSLRDDWAEVGEADLVLCSPPIGQKDWGYEELAHDPRWRYGLPPRGEPELAWVQHALAHTAPDGLAVLVMPPSAGLRRSGRRTRAELIRRGALRAVIALPGSVLPQTAMAMHLWLLVRPQAERDEVKQVLFAECPARVADDRWPELSRELHDLWRRFVSGEGVGEPAADIRAAEVPPIDLLDDEVDLTPARWLPPPVEAAPHRRLPELRRQLAGVLAGLAEMVPDVGAGPGEPLPSATVAELLRTGGLMLLASKIRPGEPDGDGPPMLTPEDVRSGAPPSRKAPTGAAVVDLRPGDVVVTQAGRGVAVRVATEADAGAALGPHLALLRPDPAVYDPWFVAGFLQRPANVHQATASSTHRIEIRRAELPRGMPLSEQRRYAESFRRTVELERALSTAGKLADNLRNVLSEGFASGQIAP